MCHVVRHTHHCLLGVAGTPIRDSIWFILSGGVLCPLPLYEVLISMPGIRGPGRRRPCWPRPWARPPGTGAQPASYAGLAPVTRRSGSSIRGEVRLPRRQQEAQARHVPLRLRLPALRPRLPGLLPAQTRPRQTALGQAVLALAHRRILTLHAMIRNHTLYNPQPATKLPTAA